jgi:hypothetical protein
VAASSCGRYMSYPTRWIFSPAIQSIHPRSNSETRSDYPLAVRRIRLAEATHGIATPEFQVARALLNRMPNA